MADKSIEIRINAAVEAAEAAETVGQLRRSLEDLQKIAEEGDLGADQFEKLQRSISQTTDELADATGRVNGIRDEIRTLDGSPVERLNNSFGLLGEGITNLDFDKVTLGLKGIGAAIAANPIGLLVTVVEIGRAHV